VKNKLYGVMGLCKKQTVKVNNCSPILEAEINISWADGMVGAIPVFKDKESAVKYAGKVRVFEIEMHHENDSNRLAHTEK